MKHALAERTRTSTLEIDQANSITSNLESISSSVDQTRAAEAQVDNPANQQASATQDVAQGTTRIKTEAIASMEQSDKNYYVPQPA